MSSPERDVDMLPPHMLDAKAEAAIADTLRVNVTAWDGTVHPARTTNLARRPRTQSSSHSQEATHGEEHTMRVASWRADGAATEVAIAIDEARKAPRTSTSSRNNPPLLPGTPGSRADSSSGVRSVLTLSSETHSEQRSSEPLTQSGQGRAKRRGLSRSAAAASFIVNKFEASSYVRIEHSRLDESLVSFSLKQFCEQALVQVFIPFGSLYTWWYHGSAALRNAELHYTQTSCWMQWFTFLAVVATLIMCELLPEAEDAIPRHAHWVALVGYVGFRCIICIKYAYMYPEKYKRWYGGCEERTAANRLARKERVRENLTTWMQADEEHIRSEIRYTATRLGVCLHSAGFSVVSHGNGVGDDSDTEAASPTSGTQRTHALVAPRYKWMLQEALFGMLRRAMKQEHFHHLMVLSLAFGVAQGATNSGLVAILTGERSAPTSAVGIYVMVSTGLVSFLFAYLMSMFAGSAFIDYQRRYAVLRELELLVSYGVPETITSENWATDTPPKVSLLITENVHMFLLARRVLLNMGLRYRKRLQMYTSLLVSGVFWILLYFFIEGMNGTLEASPFTWTMVLDAMFTICLLVGCLFKGSAANSLYEAHAALLSARCVETVDAIASIRRRSFPMSNKMAATLEDELRECAAMLRATKQELMHDHKLRAVTLLGARANPGLIRNTIVFGATVVSLLLRVMLASSTTTVVTSA